MTPTAGWVFVSKPSRAREPSQIIVHVRLWDKENLAEQEALGHRRRQPRPRQLHLQRPAALINSLVDNIGNVRVEVDMIQFCGPAFAHVDNRLMALQLVQSGLTNAALFTADGEVIQPSEAFYKKCILVERGSFRPVTKVTLDMLRCAQAISSRSPTCRARTS